MNKQEFLEKLRAELEKRSVTNIDNMIEFYDEMICDRVEDGMSEEDAIASMASISDIVDQAVLDKAIPVLVKERVTKSRDEAKKNGNLGLWITLAVLGFPLWFPLAIAFAAIIFALFIVLWSLVFTLFAIFVAFIAAAVGCLALPFLSFSAPSVLMCVGGALAFGGIAYLLWAPIKAASKGLVNLIKDFLKAVKKLFV